MRIFQRNHLLDFENFPKLFNFGRKQPHQMRPAVGSRVGHAAISFDRRVERCAKTSDFSAERLCRRRRVSSLGTLRLRPLAAGGTRRRIAQSLVPSECRVSVGPALPLLVGKHLSVTISLDRRVERCAQTADFPYERLCRRRQNLFPRVAGGRRLASPKIPSDTGDSRRVEAAGLRESDIYTSRESQVNNNNLL